MPEPNNTLLGPDGIWWMNPPRPRTVGKGSVQQTQEALGQHNLLSRMFWGVGDGLANSYDAMGRLPTSWNDAAQQFLTVMPGGGLTGIFAGRRAATANLPALARAEEMATAGRSRDDIWHDTGWFQGRDGQWRFELDDSGLRVREGEGFRGVINHPELFQAYRRQRIHGTVEEAPEAQGGYTALGGMDRRGSFASLSVAGPTPEMRRHGVGHELQHHVQPLEGFSLGGQPQMFSPLEVAAEMFRSRTLSPAQARYELYRRLDGEVEARNAAGRMDMTPAERRANPPWTTQDVPDDRQIVRRR